MSIIKQEQTADRLGAAAAANRAAYEQQAKNIAEQIEDRKDVVAARLATLEAEQRSLSQIRV